MIFSKANLEARMVASTDEFDQGLHGLRVESDGSTVAGNGKMMLAVSPASRTRARVPDVGEEADVNASGLVLTLDHVDDVIKNMPKTKKPELQYSVMTKGHGSGGGRVELTTYDMRRVKKIEDAPKPQRYPDWKSVLRKVAGGPNAKEGEEVGICVNRADLIAILKAMEKTCPDKGDFNPVYITVGKGGGGLLLRSVNYMTAQNVLGFVQAMPVREWLSWSTWERGLWGVVKKIRRKK
jgi:hypothetical protein